MKKAVLILRLVIVGILFIILLLGLAGAGYFSFLDRSEEDMATSLVSETHIPPIDANAPSKTETATFAMG